MIYNHDDDLLDNMDDIIFQVRTLDPKAVSDENCTGNTSDGNNTWYTLSLSLSKSACMEIY